MQQRRGWRGAIVALALALAGAASGCGDSDNRTIPPEEAYCNAVAEWPDEWEREERRLFEAVNQRRSVGADCGARGVFAPTGALAPNTALRCAARQHVQDMAERGYFAHTNPEGEEPWDRVDRTGYEWQRVGENLAVGATTVEAVMQGLVDSDGHCANIMNPAFDELGVGFFYTSDPVDTRYRGYYWAQVFASPE